MSKQVTAWVLSGALLASAAIAGGCARREHIRSDYGEPSRAWFDAQAANTAKDDAEGLDSEEAALIHQSYRGVLSRDNASSSQDQSQVLIIEEPRRNDRSRRR